MSFLTILVLSGTLALGCFIVGNLPLSFSFSKTRIAQLSTLGIGLLLGAGLGVIIPEGVEAIFKASSEKDEPSRTVAFTLIGGFMLMLLVEQVLLPSTSSNDADYALLPNGSSTEASRSSSNLHVRSDSNGAPITQSVPSNGAYRRAKSITFGLVIHSLADGLALGASAFSSSAKGHAHAHRAVLLSRDAADSDIMDQLQTSSLTLVVFFALFIHKMPTALALSTSLLPLIPPRRIRLHILVFSLATPLGAVLSFILLGFSDIGGSSIGKLITAGVASQASKSGLWAGIALAFSGGTFLYVATVLQPVGGESGSGGHAHAHPGEEASLLGPKARVALIVLGMVLPIIITTLIGHGHG